MRIDLSPMFPPSIRRSWGICAHRLADLLFWANSMGRHTGILEVETVDLSKLPTIMASQLYDLVSCPHRVSQDVFGDPAQRDEVSPFIRMLWDQGTMWEHKVVEDLELRRR